MFEFIQTILFFDYFFYFTNAFSVFCIHYLFLNRINQDLDRYRDAWNNHKLSTERSRTPHLLLRMNEDKNAAVNIDLSPNTVAEDEYGVEDGEEDEENNDDDAEVADGSDEVMAGGGAVRINRINSNNYNDDNMVHLEPITCPLSAEQYQIFSSAITVLTLHDKIIT
jgi:hypothetical protein